MGTKFGRWTVVGPSVTDDGDRMLLVECACGTVGYRYRANITSGRSTSCGCSTAVAKPHVGDTIGEWQVLEYETPYHVRVRCSCGVEARRYVYSLGTASVSCGHPVARGDLTKYGKSPRARGNNGRERSKLRRTLAMMHSRCSDPSDVGYPLYGGRGIRVCPEWSDEDRFIRWALAKGYRVGNKLQIDRVDSDGPYSPGNCRWVSPTENSRNRRNTRFLTAFGETKALGAWIEDPRCVVSYSTLHARLKAGKLSPEDSLSSPTR